MVFQIVLICISLIAKEVEHDLKYLLAIELLLLRILCSVQYPIVNWINYSFNV